MLPEAKLDALLARHEAVEAEMSRQLAPDHFIKLSREFAELLPVVDKIRAYRSAADELAGVVSLIGDASTDDEMRTIALLEKSGTRTQDRRARAGHPHRAAAQGCHG